MEDVQIEEKTEGGIFLPQVEKTELGVGKIVAVGPDVCNLKRGHVVIYEPKLSWKVGKQILTDYDAIMAVKGD